MKKFIIGLVCVIVGFLGVYLFITHGESDASKALRRVETMLKGITSTDGGNTVEGDEESAICMWWCGKLRIFDRDIFEEASDQFDRWRIKVGIPLYITSYTVNNSEKQGNGIIVSGTIDGAPYKVRVPEDGPVAWHESPDFE
ncbi:MAG: hypothetical protein PVH61_09370 [Candidatus Aminicenantes bacterium]